MDNKKRWFLDNAGQISGPHDDHEIESAIHGVASPLVWGRGMGEWLPPDLWRLAATEIRKQEALQPKELARWRFRTQGQESELISYQSLIEQLKNLKEINTIELWAEGFTNWKDIYQIRTVVDDLGISRRAHARVPILGTFDVDSANGIVPYRLSSISEGGLGILNATGLKIGEKIKGHVTSQNLPTGFNCNCEIVYAGSDGYTGLKFINLPVEAKSLIIEYVKKFKSAKI